MKKTQYARPELVEPIRKELNLAPDAPLRVKLDRIEKYCLCHPRISQSFVCRIAGVSASTFASFRYRNKRGNTVFARHRADVLRDIQALYPKTDELVVMAPLLRMLQHCGHRICMNTLRSILKEQGYRLLRVNQNG